MGKVATSGARPRHHRVRKSVRRNFGAAPVEISAGQTHALLNHPRKQRISAGGYGFIFKVPFRGRFCAMKVGFKKTDYSGESGEVILKREIDLTRKAMHASASSHVVRMVAYHKGDKEKGTPPLMLMEWAPNGDLADVSVPAAVALDHAIAMFESLVAIHRNGVVHWDVKPDNLLVARDESVRLADFGLAVKMSEAKSTIGSETAGSPGFEAPECHLKQWEKKKLGKNCIKLDVFAGGMTAITLLANAEPAVPDQQVLLDAIAKAEQEPHILDLRTDLRVRDKRLQKFITQTLQRDPAKRATAREAIKLLRAMRR